MRGSSFGLELVGGGGWRGERAVAASRSGEEGAVVGTMEREERWEEASRSEM